MHPHNHAHGAAQVLAVAATGERVWTVRSIPGHIQHSSDLLDPCAAEQTLPRSLTAFVWSRSAAQRRQRAGHRNQVATGAAWLHLLDLDPALLEPEPPIDPRTGRPEVPVREEVVPSGSLVFAEHGLEGACLVPRIVAASADRFGDEFTVALRHRDALTAPIVDAYAAHGVRTVDLGPSADDPGSSEPRELPRLHDLLRRFDTVAANSARDELLYASTLGRPIAIIDATPEHRSPVMGAEELAQLAESELGIDDKLSPEELLDLFEWSPRRA